MTANDTRHRLADDEKRRRMEQIEAILRRLNPELTDEQLKKLMMQFRRRSGLGGPLSPSPVN
jgi:hypothetical protein